MAFVHLHRHSEFSLLDGVGTAEHYVERAVEIGHTALAITDHGNLAGALYHVEACERHGIKPILGMEAYFRASVEEDRAAKLDKNISHLILLAKNHTGWRNLMRLSSLSYDENHFYRKPSIDWKSLRAYSEGLIASSSCASGKLPKLLIDGDTEGAELYLRTMLDIFGDDFYLEVQPHDFEKQRQINVELSSIADKHGMPIVAAVDSHYPFRDWADTQDIAVMIGTNSSLKKREEDKEADRDYMHFSGTTFWLMSEAELKETFDALHPDFNRTYEAIANSAVIADRIEHLKMDKSPKIPKATKNILEAERIVREWCVEGLDRIGKTDDPIYKERLELEIKVMRTLRVFDYFIIVGDVVRWAKSQGIRVGPGRGSAAGSLVNYLIGITALDPIGYSLLFERFLNEYRTELPDIDIDFQHDRRDEIKDYLKDKWGEDYVVDISAFQSFGLKAAVQSVSRALDVPYIEAKRATDSIPDLAFGETLDSLEGKQVELRLFFKKYPEVRHHALRLQGQMKGLSRHAAAVIVTDRPAADLIPMMKAKDGGIVTQWSERANAQLISPYGFLKIDALSTDSLTAQVKAIQLIKERHGVDIDFEDPKQFPVVESPLLSDPVVIKAFTDGANMGVFQFASRGISGLLKEIKPDTLEHIIATNALYRPGTLDNGVAFDYAHRKNGTETWSLPHPSVEPFIASSFGFMIYQEQVMQIYRVLGKDVQDAETAIFLKVVAKGIARDLEGKKKLQPFYDKFAAGCAEKGLAKRDYDLIWAQILQMTTYAFNRSHSAGYALQGYQDKWLKTYYPLEFYSALLSIESESKPKDVPKIIREGQVKGVKVGPPDINTSDTGFTIDGNSIRFGLLAIKDVGQVAIGEILEARPFKAYEDFYDGVPKAKVNKRVKSALYKSGAFDSLGGRESWTLDDDGLAASIIEPIDDSTRASMEKETIGFALSRGDNDVLKYKKIIEERVDTYEELQQKEDGHECVVGGEVVTLKEHKQKNGGIMAFIDIAFGTEEYRTTWFADEYKRYRHILAEGAVVLAMGDWDAGRETVVVTAACSVTELANDLKKKR